MSLACQRLEPKRIGDTLDMIQNKRGELLKLEPARNKCGHMSLPLHSFQIKQHKNSSIAEIFACILIMG